jgi:hypothetical protein
MEAAHDAAASSNEEPHLEARQEHVILAGVGDFGRICPRRRPRFDLIRSRFFLRSASCSSSTRRVLVARPLPIGVQVPPPEPGWLPRRKASSPSAVTSAGSAPQPFLTPSRLDPCTHARASTGSSLAEVPGTTCPRSLPSLARVESARPHRRRIHLVSPASISLPSFCASPKNF